MSATVLRLNIIPITIISLLISPKAGNPSKPELGRNTFVAICSSCHGIDGHATLSYAPSFYYGERLEKNIKELIRSVREGLGRMSPQEADLSNEQIANAIAYARTLKK